MRYFMVIGFTAAGMLLSIATSAQAQDRSMAKTWTGIGLMAGGVVTAFSRQDCRVGGILSDETAVHLAVANVAGAVGVTFDGRNPVVSRVDGRCMLDWTIDSRVLLVSIFGDEVSPVSTRPASEFREDFPKEIEETRGDAAAQAFWPKGMLYGGLAMAGVGALLATVWADTAAARRLDIRFTRHGVRASRSFGW